mmetsp:Transcript_35099/g.72141  ORF Transcript_35099/g.72141 Transcript_35099/m.72141 type:complete len:302 (+) Transcript_35099:37-942(+)
MGLLSGYGSDESTSSDDRKVAKRRRVVRLDYAKLPMSRPLPLPLAKQAAAATEELPGQEEGDSTDPNATSESENQESLSGNESSEKEAQETELPPMDEDVFSSAEPSLSLVSLLPRPKKELVLDPGKESQIEIDFATAGKPKEKPHAMGDANAWVVRAAHVPEITEAQEAPSARLLKHPLLRTLQASPAGPSQAEVDHLMSSSAKVMHISADSMKDPEWQMNNLLTGQPGLLRASRVPSEISQYDQVRWQSTTMSNPSKTQKRKHHINWLAHEAIEKEQEDLDRAAGGKLTKAQTRSRYGW